MALTHARPQLGRSFYSLFLASLLVAIAQHVGLLSRSFVMQAAGFTAVAISSTAAVAGALVLPFPLLSGRLSDRLGRRPVLIVGYLMGSVGLLILAVSGALWQFWVAMGLLGVMMAVNSAVGAAMVTDLVAVAARGRAIARFNATNWLGASAERRAQATALIHQARSSGLCDGFSVSQS